jgi:hypothetical protein
MLPNKYSACGRNNPAQISPKIIAAEGKAVIAPYRRSPFVLIQPRPGREEG